ncbi:MAG: hypothetical protein ABR549_01875, partial [Mycobacteriales bacterium]
QAARIALGLKLVERRDIVEHLSAWTSGRLTHQEHQLLHGMGRHVFSAAREVLQELEQAHHLKLAPRLDDVAADGSTIHIGALTLQVPVDDQPALQQQRIHSINYGAAGHEPFLQYFGRPCAVTSTPPSTPKCMPDRTSIERLMIKAGSRTRRF